MRYNKEIIYDGTPAMNFKIIVSAKFLIKFWYPITRLHVATTQKYSYHILCV